MFAILCFDDIHDLLLGDDIGNTVERNMLDLVSFSGQYLLNSH